MSGQRRPDIVVGIDIGQTCSGVAYSIGPDWSEPRTLNRWPGYHGEEKADKVATRVGYSKDTRALKTWGFSATYEDPTVDVREHFKLTLDDDFEDSRGFSCQDARKWYYDYLSSLHRQIGNYFDSVVPRWRDMRIEYNFSTPTTWRNPAMIASLEKIIKSAGFESTPYQTVRMSLTEAEAAAIEASTTKYQLGDVFLILDAGGGTTDVNMLKVKSVDNTIELMPLGHVEGVSIGSTLIDNQMAMHIIDRLQLISDHLDGDMYQLAEEMLMGRFQTVKHSFPNPVVDQFFLDVRGLAGKQSFPDAGIVDSRMAISRATIAAIFDRQITAIFELIDSQIVDLETRFPRERASYIILSGGLGSSPYLFDEIRKRYELNLGFKSRNTTSLRIMKVPDPQLCVVKGLVRERTQNLGTPAVSGQDVFKKRRCRNSYGVVIRAVYNENIHRGLLTVTDPLDGKLWVEGLVDWFIREGEEIDVEEGIRRSYGASLNESQRYQSRTARIVMSQLPVHKLPRQKTSPGCQDVVVVNYNLTPNDMTLKNGKVWQLKKKYWKAEFYFVVRLGPADLKFQIVGKNGVMSTDHESLSVEYMDPGDKIGPSKTPTQKYRPSQRSNGVNPKLNGRWA